MTNFQWLPFEIERHENLIEPVTQLLHNSYAPLAASGMRYLATHQDAATTRRRLLEGESYLGFLGEELLSTVTLKPTRLQSLAKWYEKPGVFHFGQFCVHPSYQGKGLGSAIMDRLETRARALGAQELALDTSENAAHLIAMYTKRGYRFVEHVQWEVTNYRSVILSKTL